MGLFSRWASILCKQQFNFKDLVAAVIFGIMASGVTVWVLMAPWYYSFTTYASQFFYWSFSLGVLIGVLWSYVVAALIILALHKYFKTLKSAPAA